MSWIAYTLIVWITLNIACLAMLTARAWWCESSHEREEWASPEYDP
jgi:hypothetical protein